MASSKKNILVKCYYFICKME